MTTYGKMEGPDPRYAQHFYPSNFGVRYNGLPIHQPSTKTVHHHSPTIHQHLFRPGHQPFQPHLGDGHGETIARRNELHLRLKKAQGSGVGSSGSPLKQLHYGILGIDWYSI